MTKRIILVLIPVILVLISVILALTFVILAKAGIQTSSLEEEVAAVTWLVVI